jgi:serine/threonine protein kinase
MTSNAPKKLYQNATNNGRTGYALTKPANNGSLRTVYNVTKGRTTIRRGMAKIGSGVQGVVYLASTDKEGKRKVVIKVSATDKAYSVAKQQAKIEYDIQKKLYAIVPRHVSKPMKFIQARDFVPVTSFEKRQPRIFNYKNQMVMFSEYAHGGTLKDWMHKMGRRVDDSALRDIIRQVIGTLKTIHARLPEFRHNDLHLGNVFIDDTGVKPRAMIADFGLARTSATGSNPIVNNAVHQNFGITSRTSSKYDAHYFFNSLLYELSQLQTGVVAETESFLRRMLPGDYRGANTSLVTAYRLKNGTVNTPLPSLYMIMRDPYFRTTKRTPTKTSPANNINVRSVFKSPSRGGNAADIAAGALAGLSGVSVTTTTRRPTAAEFLRMSPRSRAALKVKSRGANNSRSVVVRNVVHTRGANVVRESVRRVPTTNRRYLPIGTGAGRVTVAAHTPPARKAARKIVNQAIKKLLNREKANAAARRVSPARVSPARRRASPAMMPEMSYAERTRLARATAAARRNAGRTARARAPRAASAGRMTVPAARTSPTRGNLSNTRAHAILNGYANAMNNQRTLTRRMLKTKLRAAGYANESADVHARSWDAKWIASRASANSATKNLRAGKNLNKRGYSANVVAVARRRVAENLRRGTNGRVRGGKALLLSKTKPELVTMAQRHRIAGASSMTKDQLVNALYG